MMNCTDVVLLQKKPGIPLTRKLCYAIGGMPYQMTSNAKGFFMQIFLLDIVQVRCSHASCSTDVAADILSDNDVKSNSCL